MAVSQCSADLRTLGQLGHCQTGIMLSHTACFWQDYCEQVFCRTSRFPYILSTRLFMFHHIHLLSIVRISTNVPCCHAHTQHLVIPNLCELQHSNKSIFVLLPLYFPKICYTVCYICKGKWMKNSLFQMISPEKLRSTPDHFKTKVGIHWAMWSYHFFPSF